MNKQQIHHHRFPNGLTLIGEEMPWLESASFAILLPVGAVHDPVDLMGLANLTWDLVQRGCGSRSSREFVETLERLGVDRSSSVSLTHTNFGGASLAENLLPALSLHADLVRRPHLPADQLEEARQVCFQELRAIEDDLAHRVLEAVRQLQYPAPWGRSVQGDYESIQAITHDDVKVCFERLYGPEETIISVAGKLEWNALLDLIETEFGDWQPQASHVIAETPTQGNVEHIPYESAQTHLAIAYPSTPYAHPDYYLARAATGILSDGMSSRLFTEVREKEGLCYTIHASLNTLREHASVLCYAATSTERAQETLDISLRELVRMRDGVTAAELERLKARIKSSLIMQQESSASRAVSMAVDWYHLGKIRSLEEVSAKINDLSAEAISDYLLRSPPENFKVASLGSTPLEVAR